jgi:predicted GIY-YIG superfamily endonuclease
MIEINIENILSYKIKQVKDFNKGGFYLILNTRTNKKYIGKSIDYLGRLKQHLYK